MPEDWQGVRLGALDTRLPDRLWGRTTRSSTRGPCQPVGPRARMMRSEWLARGAQPAVATGALDNTVDLAMASAESVAIDVDEEDEDII